MRRHATGLKTENRLMPLTGSGDATSERILIIQPLAGLANRLRAVASADITAGYCGRTLFLDWVADDKCNAEWADLFENEMPSFPGPLPADVRIYQNDPANFADPGPGNLVDDPDERVLVRTYFNFKPRTMTMKSFLEQKSAFYRRLIPVAPVRERLEELRGRYLRTHPVIGVHIRRGDLVQSGDPPHYVSPTSLFIRRMRQLLTTTPDIVFFLATDDRGDEERIIAEFPGKVFTHPKESLRRDSKAGIRDALVDWLALSETTLILKSRGTSFSREAAMVRGIPRASIKRPFWPFTRYRFWREALLRRIR